MSGEIDGLTDLHHKILHVMMAGWQTTDQTKSRGIFELDDLAGYFDVPVEVMRQQLEYLEALGYVANVHSAGVDQTHVYKGLEWTPKEEANPANPHYYITENGKLQVVADIADEGGATTS